MIILKGLSRPGASRFDLADVNDDKMFDVDLYLKKDKMLSTEECNFISRLNNIIGRCETDFGFQNAVCTRLEVQFSERLPRININSSERKFLHFQDNVKIYRLIDSGYSANMEISEFKKFVFEQNISTVFTYEKYETNENKKITPKDLEMNFSDDFISAVKDDIMSDIEIYNNILDKIDFDLPTTNVRIMI